MTFELTPGGYQIKRASLIAVCPACDGHPNVAVAHCPHCSGPIVILGDSHFRDLHNQSCIVLWLQRAAQASENARVALKWKI